jgi:hypothetical protein
VHPGRPIQGPRLPLAFIHVVNRFSLLSRVLVALVLTGSVLASVAPVHAQVISEPTQPGLMVQANTEITVDPEAGSLEVTHTYLIKHQRGRAAASEFSEVIPADAQEVEARSNGRKLTVTVLPSSEGLSELTVTFPRPLNNDEEIRVDVTWRRTVLHGSANTFDRVSLGLISLAPFAVGGTESSTLAITVPTGREIYLNDSYTVIENPDTVRFELNRSAVDTYIPAPLVLEDPSQFLSTVVSDLPREVVLATSSGADDWLGEDFPALMAVLGRWFPRELTKPIEFREGYTGDQPVRRVTEGVYAISKPTSGTATVAALRAVASAWMEPLSFTDPALRSEFAEAVADRVMSAQGLSLPPRSGTWVTAMTALVAVSDSSAVVDVLTALQAGTPVYPGVDDLPERGSIDWRRFTDVYEHLAGVESTGDAMRLSATLSQVTEINQRAGAVDYYRLLEQRASPWSLPVVLRRLMTDWDFQEVELLREDISELLRQRDEMITEAATVDLGIGTVVQRQFESAAGSLNETREALTEQQEALDHVAEALRLETGDRGLLSSLGMWGRSVDSQRERILDLWVEGNFVSARRQADRLVDDFEASVGRGTLRLMVPLAAISALLFAAAWVRRRFFVARGPQRTDW